MKSIFKLGSCALLSALLASCAALPRERAAVVVTAQNAQRTNTISGTVTELQRTTLPDSAIVTVVLQEQTSKQAVPGVEQAMRTGGQQAPFSFELSYNLAQLIPDHTYAVAATISVDDQIAYASKDPALVNVFSDAPISGVELVVEPVQEGAVAEQPAPTQASPLEGTDWQWASMDANGATTTPVPGTTITLSFGSDGSVTGSSGCNTYSGSYRTAEGGQIIFGDLTTTHKSCPDAVMKQEEAYLELLGTGGTYNLSGERLTLSLNQGKNWLKFGAPGSMAAAPPANLPLIGTKWTLSSIESSGARTELVQGTAITLDFGPGTQLSVSGDAGCNQYSGSYTTNGENITIGPLAVTQKACDQAVMNQESAYLQALQNASKYLVEGGVLQLMDDSGQQMLHFTGLL
jgi:heat shock protein HslJ/uncharacterized lipoprotein YbaY